MLLWRVTQLSSPMRSETRATRAPLNFAVVPKVKCFRSRAIFEDEESQTFFKILQNKTELYQKRLI